MMKILIILSLLLLATTAQAVYQIDFYDFTGQQEYDYVTYRKDTNEELFSEKFTISKQNFRGEDFLVIKTDGRALTQNDHLFNKQTLTYYAIQNDRLNTYYHENKTTKEDKPYLTFKINFDWPNQLANYSLADAEKDSHESKDIKLSKNTVLTHGLGAFFQQMILQGRQNEPFTVIFPNGRTLNLRAKLAGPEKVLTRAGSFLCQRIEMKPDFGFISMFVPTVTFWFMSNPPYSYVRYEGPERGLYSPTVVQELVSANKL